MFGLTQHRSSLHDGEPGNEEAQVKIKYRRAPSAQGIGLDATLETPRLAAGCVRTLSRYGITDGWVARLGIAGPGDRYGYKRTWIQDSPNNAIACPLVAGLLNFYPMERFQDGVYELDSLYGLAEVWQCRRVYLEVSDKQVVRWSLTRQDADDWLCQHG